MATSITCRAMFLRGGYFRCVYLTAPRLPVRVRYSSSDSAGDSDSDGSSQHIPSKTQPGNAIRARKSAAADELIKQQKKSAEQTLDAKLASAVDEIANTLPAEHQAKTRSELLQKLLEHSTASSLPQSATNFTSVLAGMRIDDSESVKRSSNGRFTARVEPTRKPPSTQPERRRQPRVTGELVPGVTQLFQGPSLGIFSAKEHKTEEEPSQVQLTVFDKLEAEDSEHLLSLPPSNAFEEMIRWTEEGKLWKFPIDNEQGMDEEAKCGFHEHIFLEPLLDGRFPSSGPVRHYMELVCVGLSKNPDWTVAEKQAHIAWYEEYFKDKYHLIEANQASAAEAGGDEQQPASDVAS